MLYSLGYFLLFARPSITRSHFAASDNGNQFKAYYDT